jgi:hypothetical protein
MRSVLDALQGCFAGKSATAAAVMAGSSRQGKREAAAGESDLFSTTNEYMVSLKWLLVVCTP